MYPTNTRTTPLRSHHIYGRLRDIQDDHPSATPDCHSTRPTNYDMRTVLIDTYETTCAARPQPEAKVGHRAGHLRPPRAGDRKSGVDEVSDTSLTAQAFGHVAWARRDCAFGGVRNGSSLSWEGGHTDWPQQDVVASAALHTSDHGTPEGITDLRRSLHLTVFEPSWATGPESS